jgi:hypothetical protein
MSVEQDIPQRGKSSGIYNSISAIGIRPNLSLTKKDIYGYSAFQMYATNQDNKLDTMNSMIKCGAGEQTRYRNIRRLPSEGGRQCPSLGSASKVFEYEDLGGPTPGLSRENHQICRKSLTDFIT